MKVKTYFLRLLLLMAFIVPWVTQAQNTQVREYEYTYSTATYSSISSTGTAWTPADYVDVVMPFGIYFGEDQIDSGSILRVFPDGSASFPSLEGSMIAPLQYGSGYTPTATSIYTKATTSVVTAEWRKVVANGSSYSFQLKIYPSGDFEFCYGPMTYAGPNQVFVGFYASSSDVFRCSGNAWDQIIRDNSGSISARTLSSSYPIPYDVATSMGAVYSFHQPDCVKPTGLTATATDWSTVHLSWDVINDGSKYEIAYGTTADFNADAAPNKVIVNDGTVHNCDITTLSGGTTYWFAIRTYCGNTASGWYRMTSSVPTPQSCPTPYSSNFTLSTAGVASWSLTSYPNISSIDIYYSTDNIAPDDNTTPSKANIAVSTENVDLAAETAIAASSNTTWYVWFRGHCTVDGGNTTLWIGSKSFRTPCGIYAVTASEPYFEGFENYSTGSSSIPDCWYRKDGYTGAYVTSSNVHTGSRQFTFYSGSSSNRYMALPQFEMPSSGLTLEFWTRPENFTSSSCATLRVGYMTDVTDISTFVTIDEYAYSSFSGYEKKTVNMPLDMPSGARIAFYHTGTTNYYWYIDDVTVKPTPTCKAPSGLDVDNVSGSSVTLSWNETGSATAWQIAVDGDEDNLITANSNPFTVTGLTAEQTYSFKVRAYCASDDQSDWSNEITATPTNAAILTINDGTSTNGYVPVYGYYVDNKSRSQFIIPAADITAMQWGSITKLTFYASNASVNWGSARFDVYMAQANGTTISSLADWNTMDLVYSGSLGISGNLMEITLTTPYQYMGGDLMIGINETTSGTYVSSSWYGVSATGASLGGYGTSINQQNFLPKTTFNYLAGEPITCLSPIGLTASNVTATTATLTWNEMASSTQWEVKYGPQGFNPDETGNSIIVNTNPTLTLDCLDVLTGYDAYVRAICDPEGPTEWSSVASFTTACPNPTSIVVGTQTTVFSSGNGNVAFPSNLYYYRSTSNQIYTAAELGNTPATFNSITFTLTGTGSLTFPWEIYLVETDKTSFTSNSDWTLPGDAGVQLVYSGDISNPPTGALTLQFTNPFNYSGQHNLMLIVKRPYTSSYSSSFKFAGFAADGMTNCALTYANDNNDVTSTTSGSLSNNRNVVTFGSCDMGECLPPIVTVAPSYDVRGQVMLTFTAPDENENSFGFKVDVQGFDPTTASETGAALDGDIVALSLQQETTYDLYVYSHCMDVDNPRMVRYSFTTPFVPDCKVPNTFVASNVSYTGATISWNQADPQPAKWILQYGTDDTFAENTQVEVTGSASYTLTGLEPATTYYVRAKSVCTEGVDESPWSTTRENAFAFPTLTCYDVTGLTVPRVTNRSIALDWDAAEGISSWTVAYGTEEPDQIDNYTTVDVNESEYIINNLAGNTKYYVYVRANCAENVYSAWVGVYINTLCPDGGDVTIGNGSSNNTSIPMMSNYDYSYTQQIYYADEIGGATTIDGISFDEVGTVSVETPIKIYLAETDKNAFASTSDYVTADALTLVYEGNYPSNTSGMHRINFDTPFEYSGANNLVVVFDNNRGSYSSGVSHRVHNTDKKTVFYHYTDNVDITPENPLNSYNGTPTITNVRANIIFHAPCNADATCIAPVAVTNPQVSATNEVTLSWTVNPDLEPMPETFEVRYGLAGTAFEDCTGVISNITSTTATISGSDLAKETDYVVYVATKCGVGDYSTPRKATFTTYPTCWVPTGLMPTAPTANSVVLSWTENSPVSATRWDIAYGPMGFDPNMVEPVEGVTANPYTLEGLKHTTKYEFYVRAHCSENDYSDWSNAGSFITGCAPYAMNELPIEENFDSYTGTTSASTNVHALCWSYRNTGTNNAGLPTIYSTSSSMSGNNCLYFSTRSTDSYGEQYAILPEMGFDVDTLDMVFNARMSSTSDAADIVVGVMTNPEEVSTFEAVETLTPASTTYEEMMVSLAGYTGNGRYVAIKCAKPASGYAGFYLDDLTLKVREKSNTLPNTNTNLEICSEYIVPTLDEDGNYASNLTITDVIRPSEPGKVVRLSGAINTEYGYDFLSIYEGVGTNGQLLYRGTGSDNINVMTTSTDWVNNGALTIVFTTDDDNAVEGLNGFKLLANCECPMPVEEPLVYNEIVNGTYTWINGQTYTNNATTANAEDLVITDEYIIANVAGCDSVYSTLNLLIHPTYTLTYEAEICERDVYDFYGQQFTTRDIYTVTLQSEYGADSTGILNLQVHPAPTATISYNGRNTTLIDSYCDNADLTLTARSDNNNSTFAWEDASTNAVRTVNPHDSNTYTVVATETVYGCTSLPASVKVYTTPVAELSITATDSVVCAGEPTTLTVAATNGLDVTYRWNTGATTASITVNPTEATTYTVTATTAATGCPTTAEFTVGVNPLPIVEVSTSVDEICLNDAITLNATEVEGYSYIWNDNPALTSASQVFVPAAVGNFTYTVNVTDANGCVNSFTTNSVAVHPSYEMNDEKSACIGMLPYTWGTQSLEAAGQYDQHFKIAYDCDSLVHLNFIVEDTAVTNYYQEVCEGANITFGEGDYKMDFVAVQTIDTSYIDTTSGECPARHTLHLTVNHPVTNSFDEDVCDAYTWNGVEYTETGNYDQTLATTKGCDSTVTLHLTVRKSTTGVDVQDVCDQLVWKDGNTYTEPNTTATFDTTNVAGCDSVITLNLTIRHQSAGVDSVVNYCAARSYTWIDGETYIMDETEGNITYLLPGMQNVAGCDTTAILYLVFNLPVDTLNWKDTVACDEFIIDTVSCDNTVNTAYIRESGDYQLRIHGDNGGDVIARYHLTVQQSSYHTTLKTECLPYTWFVGDNEIATITTEMVNGAAVYNMSVDMAELGFVASTCNNIEVLRLTPLYPTYDTTDTVVICKNGFWEDPNHNKFEGSTTISGVHIWDFSENNPAGCTLYKMVDLTVNPTYDTTINLTLCENQFENESYTYQAENGSENEVVLTILGPLNGQPYSNTVNATWTASTGCDSVMTFKYTVNPILRDTLEVATCYKYTWEANGVTYKQDTVDSVSNVSVESGCDSISYLVLTISDTIHTYKDTNVCTKYEYKGETYFETKTFVENYTAESGCDSLLHITFVVHQNVLNEQFVYANRPYTWVDGKVYDASTQNVFYKVPVVEGCDSILKLTFTMGQPVSICEGQLPYTVQIGNTSFVITDAVSGEWTNEDALGNDTIVAYTILRNASYELSETACDSYIWHGTNYTTSGDYEFDTIAANGCDSTATLHLTINNGSHNVFAQTACDSYTWHDTLRTVSGDYTYSYTNEAGCASVDTLHLTINKNNGVEETLTTCDSLSWHGQKLTLSDTYTHPFVDMNGCLGDSVLNLTVNNTVYQTADSLVNAASTIYNGVLYTAPTDTTINDTVALGAANGCDSITAMHLRVELGGIITEDTVYCGDFTWRDGNTYTWIPVSERVNPAINYKNRATGVPVSEFPTYAIYDEEGVVLSTYVLKLTLQEAHTEYKDVTVLLGDNTYTDPANGHSFDFTVEKAAKRDTTVYDTLHLGSDYYCDDIVYYTFHLVYNYDTINDTVCAEQTEYVFNGHTYSLGAGASSQTSTVFSCGFEESDDIAWKFVDADQDGYNWTINLFPETSLPHTGTGYIASQSYINYQGSLNPDNWLISPAIILPNGSSTLSWFCKSQDSDYPDSYSVYISTTGNETTDFTTELLRDTPYDEEYVERTADLSTYAGQTVYIAFRHHNSADEYILLLDDISITSDQVSDFTFTDTVGTGDNRVVTILNVNKRPAVTGTETIAACDSTRWNNTLYTESVVNQQVTLTGAAANGCDSIVTLNITITPTIHNVTMDTVCDSYVWHDNTYTASTTDIFTYPNVSNPQCSNVDTLKLVVKNSTTGTDVQTACDSLEWIDGTTYYASNTTATHTLTNAAGCDSVVTLNLTINNRYEGRGTDIDTLGASINLTDINGTYLFLAPYDNDTTLTYQTVAGCDSIVTFHIKVSQYEVITENQIACGIYSWERTNHTYKWISNDEKNANAIVIPGASSMLPFYKDITANAYVYTRPTDTVDNQVYELNLNLNEAAFEDSTIARFPQSMNVLTLNGTTFDFTGMTSATEPVADTVVYLTLPHASLCGTVKTYNVHVVYNYITDDTTVCFTNEFEWEDGTTSDVNVGTNNITKTLFEGDMANEVVVTRNINVRAANNLASETKTVCDSIVWNNRTYTTSGDYTYTTDDQYGCDSTTTLHLTVNNTVRKDITKAECDSTQWNGTWYYESGSVVDTTIAANGCDSITTLLLTINVNNTGVDTTVTACDEFTWAISERTYTASNDSISFRTQDENGCWTVNHLHLTINKASSYDSVLWVTDGSYRYIAQDGTSTLILAGESSTFIEHYTNAVGCDSTLNITVNVGEGYFAVDDTTRCNSYTWRDGNTYVWISAEERAANNALFKNQTTGTYVTSNPIWRVANEGDYDSIYMLRLNLTQNFEKDTTIDFPISLDSLTYGDSTFYFHKDEDEAREFDNTVAERDVHFASDYYCDSVHHLHINLINNYTQVDATDICVTNTTFEWRDNTYNVATEDYDHARILYLYDTIGTAENQVVEYIKITQHPVVYATERRTACDSYTWHGTDYTESTSNATFTTVDQFGCDSTVTLLLTINKSTDSVATDTACGSFTWNGVTYMQSINVTVSNLINRAGCDSTATLNLTINPIYDVAVADTACDSYVWEGDVYTVSGVYTKTLTTINGCDSVVTMTLTINNSTSSETTVSACDSYTWNDSTYTLTGDYTFSTTNAAGCDSTATLHLTINASHHGSETLTVCDSYTWFDSLYTQSGVFVHADTTAAGCENIDTLHLTVNYSTHEVLYDTACDSYTWNGSEYTTSGVYTHSYDNEAGCPSTDTLHLVVNHGTHYGVMTVANCGPYTWVVNNDTVATYSETIETSTQFVSPVTKCDSVLFLKLTVNKAPVTFDTVTVCYTNLPYTWTVGGDSYVLNAEAGAEMDTVAVLPYSETCDSTKNLHLIVDDNRDVTFNETICHGLGYQGHGFDIAADDLEEVREYQFTDMRETSAGCAYKVILNLTVSDVLTEIVPLAACDSMMWHGTMYYESSNDITFDTVTAAGCDSIANLHLTINKSTHNLPFDTTVCDSYVWKDNNYTVSGIYTNIDIDDNGCQIFDTLNLTVNYSDLTGVEEATACDSYNWNDEEYTESGVYTFANKTVFGCDSLTTLTLTVNYSDTTVTETASACDSYTWNGQTYTVSGVYTYSDTTIHGCDSLVTLTLTINPSYTTTIDTTVCGVYVWDNRAYETSGTYYYTYQTVAGCDSAFTLNLTVNQSTDTYDTVETCVAYIWDGITYNQSGDYRRPYVNANGCDSIVYLALTIHQPVSADTTAIACDNFTWHGTTYTSTGNYIYTGTTAEGCDSIVTLHLTVNYSNYTGAEQATACDSYDWKGDTYTESGSYTYSTSTADGCDSTVTLYLTINHSDLTATETQTACESYFWNGQTYTESGVYIFANQTVRGCDSLTTLTLTINNGTHNVSTVTNCGSYTWNGQTYATSGNYTYDYINANGCASTDTLHLTVNSSTTATETVTACDSYTWHGATYTTSGTQTYTTTNANGCDSIITLNLTINHSTSGIDVQTACDSYTWRDGVTYTASTNTPTFTLQNAAGCDSVITLHLTVNHSTTGTETQSACDSYTWNGQTYTTSGNYTYSTTNAAGCDSIATLNLTINHSVQTTETVTANGPYTWNGVVYTISGTYIYSGTTVEGCDSIATLNLTFTPFVITAVANDATLGTVTGGGSYYADSTATLVATPAANARFVAWNDGDTNATRVVTVTGDATYIANFAYLPVNVTLVVSDATMGTTNPAPGVYTYEVGNPVMAQAVPAAGHLFNNWTVSINGQSLPVATNPISVTIPAAYAGASVVVIANFVPDTFDVIVRANSDAMGTVTGSGRYVYGENATITATANSGYEFLGWNDGDTNTTRTVLVTGDVTYTAMFGLDMTATLTATVNNTEWGYVLINGERSDTYVGQIGDEVTVEAYANDGYRFVNWDDQSTNFSRTVVLTENVMSMIANFEVMPVGIDEVEDETVIIYAESNRIIVRGAENKTVRVFDVVGRLVAQRTAAGVEEVFNMPNTGIYLIKVDNAPARRVVVRP